MPTTHSSSELRLPASTDSESDSEEELQSMIETHNMWSPFHYSYVSDPNPPRTYYTVVEDSELEAWETTGRTTLTLSDWKSTTSKVFQHLHLHEHPLEALILRHCDDQQLDVNYNCTGE